MRRMVLLAALAAALSGCADDGGEATTGTPTPSASPTAPTGASPTPTPEPPTPTPATPTPPPRDPLVVVNETFDFSSGQAAGPDGKSVVFTVPEGYATLRLNVTVAPKTVGSLPGTSISANQRVTILDPSGAPALEVGSADREKGVETAATPGTWTVRYDGTANAEARTVGVAG